MDRRFKGVAHLVKSPSNLFNTSFCSFTLAIGTWPWFIADSVWAGDGERDAVGAGELVLECSNEPAK